MDDGKPPSLYWAENGVKTITTCCLPSFSFSICDGWVSKRDGCAQKSDGCAKKGDGSEKKGDGDVKKKKKLGRGPWFLK